MPHSLQFYGKIAFRLPDLLTWSFDLQHIIVLNFQRQAGTHRKFSDKTVDLAIHSSQSYHMQPLVFIII